MFHTVAIRRQNRCNCRHETFTTDRQQYWHHAVTLSTLQHPVVGRGAGFVVLRSICYPFPVIQPAGGYCFRSFRPSARRPKLSDLLQIKIKYVRRRSLYDPATFQSM